jgi:hypothetical protein
MIVFIAEAQTLLTVVHTVFSLRPARIAAWRAGACPTFALRTFPKMTSYQILQSVIVGSNLYRNVFGIEFDGFECGFDGCGTELWAGKSAERSTE